MGRSVEGCREPQQPAPPCWASWLTGPELWANTMDCSFPSHIAKNASHSSMSVLFSKGFYIPLTHPDFKHHSQKIKSRETYSLHPSVSWNQESTNISLLLCLIADDKCIIPVWLSEGSRLFLSLILTCENMSWNSWDDGWSVRDSQTMHARHFLVFFRAEHNIGAYKQAASVPPLSSCRKAEECSEDLWFSRPPHQSQGPWNYLCRRPAKALLEI